jgi:ankyrin repeat protein
MILIVLFAGLYRFALPAAPDSHRTALNRALEAGDVTAAHFLLEAGTEASVEDVCCTPLHQASVLGQVRTVRELLVDGESVDAPDANGQSALFSAAATGRDDVVQALLKQGANVRLVDRFGRTALHWAAISGSEEIAAALIARGADPDAVDARGETPWALAQSAGNDLAGTH